MTILRTIKSAFFLLIKGDWHEFYIRALIALGFLDLKTITTEDLNLSSQRSYSYSDSGRGELQKVLSALDIKKGDAIIDFGCGKGGALVTMADYPFSRITGVEISRELTEIAKKNIKRLKLESIEIVCCDATDFLDLHEFNYVYLFNPFPCPVLGTVIDNLISSLAVRNRKISIIYLNPECHETISNKGVFRKVREFDHIDHKFFIYANSV